MSGSDWIGGIHAVAALLDRDPAAVLELMLAREARNPRLDEIAAQARAAGIAVQRAPRSTLERLAAGLRHQDVLANVRTPAAVDERDLPDLVAAAGAQALLLVLDGVTDPHNLGACLRSAAAAGATAVVLPKDRSAPLNAAARKAAAGGAESVPLVRVTNLARAMEQLRRDGVWIVGLAGEAEQSLYQRDLTGPLALVLGAEGEGMRRLTREHCDFLVRIPIDAAMESLNVSVAAGICLFEARRQRG
ncbi:MAG: 23S rRNA (guanosine(2251)-2'-O)-methyltransferase RlmB [Xanthomonadales bacterium]|nr:23S rRNA (guanosine(2251)-2'-O)-methyltransferase RlmB [Xanthomonadales bacterium]